MSVSLSARKEQRDSHWKNFRKITYVGRLRNYVDFFFILVETGHKMTSTLREDLCTFTVPRRYWPKDLSVLCEVRAQA